MFTNLVVTGLISLYPSGLDDFEQADEYVEMYNELTETEDDLNVTEDVLDDTETALSEAEDALSEALSEIDRLEGELDAVKDELSEANAELVELRGVETSVKGTVEQLSETEDAATPALSFEATYYTARCDGCSGITATGYDVRSSIYSPEGYRIIAVDPNVIPLGSVVRVYYGDERASFKAVASDTGGDINGHRIDILVATKEEAYRLGREDVRVEILSEGN